MFSPRVLEILAIFFLLISRSLASFVSLVIGVNRADRGVDGPLEVPAVSIEDDLTWVVDDIRDGRATERDLRRTGWGTGWGPFPALDLDLSSFGVA